MGERQELTAERARELLDYDPETGVLTWKWRPEGPKKWNTRYAGKVAGALYAVDTPRTVRYWKVSIAKRQYLAHRVIWLIQTGSWPVNEIDHINGNSLDNSFVNLRDVTRQENGQNTCKHRNNTSGKSGVYWVKKYGWWAAQTYVDGKRTYLGRFYTFEEAVAAKRQSDAEQGYHQNHGREPVQYE